MAMQCKELEGVLEEQGLSPLPEAARTHLSGCSSCQNLISDFTTIVTAARELPAEIEPPERIWIALRSQLEDEGLIKTPATALSEHSSWWHGFSDLFRSRTLATAAVGLLITAAAILQLWHPGTHVPQAQTLYTDIATALNSDEANLAGMRLASTSTVDTSLRQNLQIVNQFIAECEQRVADQPQDDLTREYLSGAYQQKAELLSAMMERGGSGN
jgi:hypothetical protein